MKKIFKYKKSIIVVTLSLVICGMMFVSNSFAFLQDVTDPLTNKFDLKPLDTEIIEDTEGELEKAPKVTNIDEADALVRMRYTINPQSTFDKYFGLNGPNGEIIDSAWVPDDWKINDTDGFWYYSKVLKSGQTTSPLFTHILINEDGDYRQANLEKDKEILKNLDGLEITLYQESIPTRALIEENGKEVFVDSVDENGDIIESQALGLWNYFDNKQSQ